MTDTSALRQWERGEELRLKNLERMQLKEIGNELREIKELLRELLRHLRGANG